MNSIDFETSGKLVTLDLWGCDFETLNNFASLSSEAKVAAEKAGMHVLAITIVPFVPQGFTIVLILSESHLSIHTTPEKGYAAIDIFTCGHGRPQIAAHHLVTFLKPNRILAKGNDRGVLVRADVEPTDGILETGRLHHA